MFQGVALLVALICCVSCSSSKSHVRVFAAASLSEAFEALGRAFEARDGERIDLQFAGTSQLVMQLQEGAAADVFASADMRQMRRVLTSEKSLARPRFFASGRLAIAVQAGNPKQIKSLADLSRPDLLVALCAPQVPAGHYAQLALSKAGVRVHSRSDELSVRALLHKVQLGEIDAGIVYRSDLQTAGSAVTGVPIPEEHNVRVQYPMLVLKGGKEPQLARRFVDFVLSASGQRILRSFGFEAP